MFSAPVVLPVSLLYDVLLFWVASNADKKREAGQSITANAHVYSLSIAVYMTTWTFYCGVGRAATVGPDFLAAELGTTLSSGTWWFLPRKMVRISKEQKITSFADFNSCRDGKSETLGTLVALIAVMGICPATQLRQRFARVSSSVRSVCAWCEAVPCHPCPAVVRPDSPAGPFAHRQTKLRR